MQQGFKKQYVYVVFGLAGSFPYDMLRYDSAIALSSCSSTEELKFRFPDLDIPTSDGWFYNILVSDRPPTIDRWNSFLWGVAPLVFRE